MKQNLKNLEKTNSNILEGVGTPSLTTPRTPRFPLHSPTTPTSLPTPDNHLNFNAFSPTLDNFEATGEILEELATQGNRSSNNILRRLLTQKEQEIERLEAEKLHWLAHQEEFEQVQIKQTNLLNKQATELKQLEPLKQELKESNDDYYQLDQENNKLKQVLNREKLNNRRQEKQLENETQENYRLRMNQEQTHHDLLAKIEELTQLKKISQGEKEQWQEIITEQQEKYEHEKKIREQRYNQQINNLRAFQLTADIPQLGSGRPPHKKTFSTNSLPTSHTNSPRGSFYEKKEEKQPSLFMEITKGNIFQHEVANSPASSSANDSDTDYFDYPPKPKKRPVSVPVLAKDYTQSFEDLLDTVDNFTNETTEEKANHHELLTEITQLKEKLTQSETAYQIIVAEHNKEMKGLRSLNQQQLQELQDFDKKEVAWKDKEKNLEEEAAELKYQLAESRAETISQKKALEQQKLQGGGKVKQIWSEVNQETNKLGEDINRLKALIEMPAKK